MVGGTLVDGFLGCKFVAAKRLRARKLSIGEFDVGCRGLQRRLRLLELDLVGAWIDREEKVALVDDLAVLEMDLGERSADLGTQFDPVDRRKLAEEAGPGIDLALQMAD